MMNQIVFGGGTKPLLQTQRRNTTATPTYTRESVNYQPTGNLGLIGAGIGSGPLVDANSTAPISINPSGNGSGFIVGTAADPNVNVNSQKVQQQTGSNSYTGALTTQPNNSTPDWLAGNLQGAGNPADTNSTYTRSPLDAQAMANSIWGPINQSVQSSIQNAISQQQPQQQPQQRTDQQVPGGTNTGSNPLVTNDFSYQANLANGQNADLYNTPVSQGALVENRLTGLLSQDNPYMQMARQAGLENAQKRGLLNSSLAGEASQLAAIKAGLPIAQQDAQTIAARESQLMGEGNQTNRFNAQQQNAIELQNAAARNRAAEVGLANKYDEFKTRLDNDLQIGRMNQQTYNDIQEMLAQVAPNWAGKAMDISAELLDRYSQQVAEIQQMPDSLFANPAQDRQLLVDNLLNYQDQQIKQLGWLYNNLPTMSQDWQIFPNAVRV